MRPRLSVVALVLTCVGLGASIASLRDALGPRPTFCAETGCETVRMSVWAHPLGIPMPIFGIAFFAAMLVLAFVSRPRTRVALALAGGAWALGLVAIQAFVLGTWCKLCMVADPAAIGLALAVVLGARTVRMSWRLGAVALPALAAIPLLIAATSAPAPVPVVEATRPAALAAAPVPGTVTIVELVDFECPFCRAFAPVLADAIAQARVPVTVVRKMVPLAMHPHAQTAALAWCCADAQGHGDAMAAALFAAPPDELTQEGCEDLAVSIGCDRDRYRAALADPALAERIAADQAAAQAADVRALPTVFIGDHRFVGSGHTTAELLAAISAAG